MLYSILLFLCQFEPYDAYESVAYKKSLYFSDQLPPSPRETYQLEIDTDSEDDSFKGIESTPQVHSVHPPPFCLRVWGWWTPNKLFKKGGLTGSQFLEGVAGKEGSDLFQDGGEGGGRGGGAISILKIN